MKNINWARFILGGLIATAVLFVSDGLLHEQVLRTDWKAVYDGLGAKEPAETPVSMLYFAIFEVGRGVMSIFIYVLMRDRFGAGPKTAVFAGISTWLAFSITGPAQFIPLEFYSHALWVKVGAFQLVTSIVAAIIAASLYKDVTDR